jgi:hypothetical protein
MPRFFLHLKRGRSIIRDSEGSVLASPDEARAMALQAAREICAEAIKNSRDIAADAFVIADETGRHITFVPMIEVLPKQLRQALRPETISGNTAEPEDSPGLMADGLDEARSEMVRLRHVKAEIKRQTDSCNAIITEIRQRLAVL